MSRSKQSAAACGLNFRGAPHWVSSRRFHRTSCKSLSLKSFNKTLSRAIYYVVTIAVKSDAGRRQLSLGFPSLLFPGSFACQRLFCSAFVPGFQIEGVLLDVLDDVFLLNLPLEPPERAFDRLTVLYLDLSQNFLSPPSPRRATGAANPLE